MARSAGPSFFLLVCLTMSAQTVFAQEELLQAELDRFDELTVIELTRLSSGDVQPFYDRLSGQVEIRAPKGFRPRALKQLLGRLESNRNIGRVSMSTNSVMATVNRLRTTSEIIRRGKRQFLAIGTPRKVESPIIHFQPENCSQFFGVGPVGRIDVYATMFCQGKLEPLLERLPRFRPETLEEQHAKTILQLLARPLGSEKRDELLHVGSRRPKTNVENKSLIFLDRACGLALQDRLPEALDILDELLRLGKSQSEKSALGNIQEFANRFGRAIYYRLLWYAKGIDSAKRAVSYHMQFRRWATPELPVEIKHYLAESYRRLLYSKNAVDLYSEMLRRGEDDEETLLTEIARTYAESGDEYRTRRTLEFIGEKFGEKSAQFELGGKSQDRRMRQQVRERCLRLVAGEAGQEPSVQDVFPMECVHIFDGADEKIRLLQKLAATDGIPQKQVWTLWEQMLRWESENADLDELVAKKEK
jgi:hypothetical protein